MEEESVRESCLFSWAVRVRVAVGVWFGFVVVVGVKAEWVGLAVKMVLGGYFLSVSLDLSCERSEQWKGGGKLYFELGEDGGGRRD